MAFFETFELFLINFQSGSKWMPIFDCTWNNPKDFETSH